MAASNGNVPYHLLRLDKDKDETPSGTTASLLRNKAIFTVPKEMAPQLTAHAILCRGSYFVLHVDEQSPRSGRSSSSRTAFLSTTFRSPRPQDLALELSRRIAIRMDQVHQLREGGDGGTTAADARSLLGL